MAQYQRFLLHYLKNADAKEPCQIIINQQLLRTFPDADVYFGEVWLPDLLALGRQLYLAFVSPTNFYGEFGLKNNLKKNFPEGNFTIAVCKDILTAERWIKDQIAPIALDIENI
ncbi:MAG: hypothetical protein EAZ55_13865 [Cytophagales bacterium]|nr:MAG: hypothetical protein EAZ55_13865 [Cytophagales bacterium]